MASPPDGWLSVGHIRRAHGLRGDVFVQLTTDRTDRVTPGTELFARGRTITVASSRTGGNGRIIAHFDTIEDRNEAERWNNAELFAAPIDDPEALWVHELIGATVVDQHGTDRGAVVSVIDNPAADLLELANGALVPANFVESFVDGIITVDVPDGLFELAEE